MNELGTRELGTHARELEVQAAEREIEMLHAQLQELHRRIRELEQHAEERGCEVAHLQARLTEITQSDGWKALQMLYRMRYAVFPSGSRRERVGRFCMHKLRRARYHARQGPGAFLRAFMAMLARPFRRARVAHSKAVPAAQTPAPLVARPPGPVVAQPLAQERLGAGPRLGTAGLVSVILPVYNQAGLLGDAIESVLRQTYPDFELIVINDGSKDNVEAVLGRYAGHPKVRILTQPNQKLPKALSNGFEFATGEFWTWTSADNLMEPMQLARLVEFLRTHPDVALVYADYLAIDDRGQPLRDPNFRPHNRRAPDAPEIRVPRQTTALNTVQDNFIGACFLYRGWVGRLLGEYTPELGVEDYDYWMRLNNLFRLAHLGTDELLYRYRVHDNTLNARAGELRILERVQRLMEHERVRHAFYQRPWTILVDDACAAWAGGATATGHTVRRLAERAASDQLPDKTLALLSADSLDPLRRELPAHVCVGLCLGDEPAGPYRQRAALRERVDLCFAPNRQVAERAALFHRNVFQAVPGQALADVAVAFANNHAFYRRTVAAEARRRRLPEPFVPEEGRPRVLVQADDFRQGGLEQVVLDLLAVLAEHRLPVSLLVLGRAGPAADRARAAGVEVLTLPDQDREAHYRQLLRDQQIEVVHAHHSWFGAPLAAELGIPFVQTVHNTYVFIPPETVAAYRENDRYTSAYACVSSNVALYADLNLGLSVTKMLITPNGIDSARLDVGDRKAVRARLRAELGLGPDDFVFLNVASVFRDKAQKLTVQALAEVVQEYPRAKVVFLGPTLEEPYLAEIRQEIERGQLERQVIFAGFRAGVAPFYALADAFVLPSFWEGWSLALAEALYVGLPIIATDVGAARDVLPAVGTHLIRPEVDTIADLHLGNIYGYLHRDHSRVVADLAAAMKRVCADPVSPALSEEARRALERRHAYRAYVRLFRWVWQGGTPAAARVWLHNGQESAYLSRD
jgi:glycosyltransferase involved in cell wall biosynthesis